MQPTTLQIYDIYNPPPPISVCSGGKLLVVFTTTLVFFSWNLFGQHCEESIWFAKQ